MEFQNGLLLFVNLASGTSRSYPNEFLENGTILTWFLRESDYTSELALKLDTNVALFIRTKSAFVCCGRCKVVPVEDSTYNLAELHLVLEDWEQLSESVAFQEIVQSRKIDG
jgi:hypothetical protein